MTPFRNDDSNPFARKSPWPGMPQSTLRLPRRRGPRQRLRPSRRRRPSRNTSQPAVEASAPPPEPLPQTEPAPAPFTAREDPPLVTPPIGARRPRARPARAPRAEPRLTPLIAAAAVGRRRTAALFLLIGLGESRAPGPGGLRIGAGGRDLVAAAAPAPLAAPADATPDRGPLRAGGEARRPATWAPRRLPAGAGGRRRDASPARACRPSAARDGRLPGSPRRPPLRRRPPSTSGRPRPTPKRRSAVTFLTQADPRGSATVQAGWTECGVGGPTSGGTNETSALRRRGAGDRGRPHGRDGPAGRAARRPARPAPGPPRAQPRPARPAL